MLAYTLVILLAILVIIYMSAILLYRGFLEILFAAMWKPIEEISRYYGALCAIILLVPPCIVALVSYFYIDLAIWVQKVDYLLVFIGIIFGASLVRSDYSFFVSSYTLYKDEKDIHDLKKQIQSRVRIAHLMQIMTMTIIVVLFIIGIVEPADGDYTCGLSAVIGFGMAALFINSTIPAIVMEHHMIGEHAERILDNRNNAGTIKNSKNSSKEPK